MATLKNPIVLFPLPSTVFYPKTQLPLHIFEPRYRQMVMDASEEDLLIGMILLKSGWDSDYFGRPPVEKIGCAGKINNLEKLPDGKFNIILEGLSRFRIIEESDKKPYRLAQVEFIKPVNDHIPQDDCEKAAQNLINQYETLLEKIIQKQSVSPTPQFNTRPQFDKCKTVGQIADQIAYSLDWDAKRRQAFLEEIDAQSRVAQIRSELELKSQIMRVSTILKTNKVDSRRN
tara:strand:+ start:2384 stop:3076 length:693 start_codon:yes stop_codon:yes gene_type:complete